MSAPWFSDESFNGISDNIFDDVIELLDFSLEPLEEDMEENGEGEDWDAKFQCVDPPPLDMLASFSYSGHHNRRRNDNAIIQKNLPTPFEETSNPDNLPRTTEATSFRNIPHHQNSSDIKHSSLFQTSSPTSVLENIASSALNPKILIPGKRARTKRPRHTTTNPWPTIIPTFSSPTSPTYQSGSVPFNPQKKIQNPIKQDLKKQLNLLQLSSPPETSKKCMHCEVTKTPQWREGPMGPKTLCNACGVRYRSGRLFPEYRPAASPTFVESVHSNSHRKVMEMRKKDGVQTFSS